MSTVTFSPAPVMRCEVDKGGEGVIRILLAEDDSELASRLLGLLAGAGFEVEHSADGEDAWYRGEGGGFDACVLDLGLPRLSGLDVLKKWRASGLNFPIVILSARNSWNERVAGLNLGADDYLGKPFQPQELLARVNAQVRRRRREEAQSLIAGDYALDLQSGVATSGEESLTLTGTELRIVRYLSRASGRIVSQSELVEHVYADGASRESNTVEVYVGRLRRKFGKDFIRTVRGLGYTLG